MALVSCTSVIQDMSHDLIQECDAPTVCQPLEWPSIKFMRMTMKENKSVSFHYAFLPTVISWFLVQNDSTASIVMPFAISAHMHTLLASMVDPSHRVKAVFEYCVHLISYTVLMTTNHVLIVG